MPRHKFKSSFRGAHLNCKISDAVELNVGDDVITEDTCENSGNSINIQEGDEYENEVENISWKDGRRVVELDVLAQGLSKCIRDECKLQLDLRNVVSETRSGYGSWLYISCVCGATNKIKTK